MIKNMLLSLVTLLLVGCSVNLNDLRALPKTDAAIVDGQSVDVSVVHEIPNERLPNTDAQLAIDTNLPGPDVLKTNIPDTNIAITSPLDTHLPDVKIPDLPDIGIMDDVLQNTLKPDVPPIPPNTVLISNDQAVGVMTGQGWIALGSQDVLTSPMCPSKITNTNRCSSVTWNSPISLCATGSIPIISDSNYTNNWGIEIGVDATPPPNTPIGIAYSTIAINFTGQPTTNLSITLHRSGDPLTTTYCLNTITSNTTYSLTKFNSACWDNSGISFTPSDAAKIDQVGLQVTSSTANAFTLTNLCLESIDFGITAPQS